MFVCYVHHCILHQDALLDCSVYDGKQHGILTGLRRILQYSFLIKTHTLEYSTQNYMFAGIEWWLLSSSRHSVVMPPPLGAGGIMFSGCPSVRPKPEITSFPLYMGPLVHPINRDRFAACLSVRPERFPGICQRTHGGNRLKFCMLMYLGHLQNWLDYSHGLLIFLLLASPWLSEMGQIWGFRAFPGQRMVGMA